MQARLRVSPRRHAATVVGRVAAATLGSGFIARALLPRYSELVAIGAAAAALAFELTRLAATLARRLDELEADVAQTQPLVTLGKILPTRRPLPPLRGYAIAPDFAVMLAELVADHRPELVVETGSGASTVILAHALERLGRGRVLALEHDPKYARRTREELARHGLTEYATVVDAPLEPVRVRGKTYRWYSPSAIDHLQDIDLVVDDGPPRHVGDELRYASLHLLAPRMHADGLFVLDVVGEEEREMLRRWRAELPELHHEHVATKKGNVLIRRQSPG